MKFKPDQPPMLEQCPACASGNHKNHQHDYMNRQNRVTLCKCTLCTPSISAGAKRKPGPKGPRKPGATVATTPQRETWDVTVRITVPPAVTEYGGQAVIERLIGERCNLQTLPRYWHTC